MLGSGRQSQPYMVVDASHGDVMAKPRPHRKVKRCLSSSCHVALRPTKRKRPLFKKSGAKIFVYAGPWALSATTPMAQHKKVFLLLFVHKKKPSPSLYLSPPWLYSLTIMSITSRFAPSPTGFLHLGHAYSAWTAWRRADRFWLRLEDIDTTRCRPAFSAAIVEDLAWLGLDWAPGVRVQSEHFAEYRRSTAASGSARPALPLLLFAHRHSARPGRSSWRRSGLSRHMPASARR